MKTTTTNPKFDENLHLMTIHAAVLTSNARILYREAWRIRRLMFRNSRNDPAYTHYWAAFNNIRNLGQTGERCAKQIADVAHQTLGTF